MEVMVAYRRGHSKKNNGKARLIVQAGWTYDVLKRLIAKKLSSDYNYKVYPSSIHIRAVDVTITCDHNDYRRNRRYPSKPHFRVPHKKQHVAQRV